MREKGRFFELKLGATLLQIWRGDQLAIRMVKHIYCFLHYCHLWPDRRQLPMSSAVFAHDSACVILEVKLLNQSVNCKPDPLANN